MADHFKPRDETDICEALEWGLAAQTQFEIISGGTKRGLGRVVEAGALLDLSALSGITLYEPAELVLSAAAATPLADINKVLAEHGQELAFEPVDHGPLFGLEPGSATIGGILAGNIAGTRRLKAGAARDHFLGVRAVSGRGELFKSGGRVVKNVTGYDLCKGLCGSWGTLAVMTEVTLKVLPACEQTRTIVLHDLTDSAAQRAMARALGSAYEVSGAAHLPAAVCAKSKILNIKKARASITALRIEGFGPSVDYRADKLTSLLTEFGSCETMENDLSKDLWSEISNCAFFCDEIENPLWRISLPPMSGADVIARILDKIEARYFLDWAGGLIWLECADQTEAHEEVIRSAMRGCGGHATLIRANQALRRSVAVFHPQPAALAKLTKRLKESFDPKAILNPGRMYEGV